MRKLFYAGAAFVGGIFLFGAASPAHADLLPGTGTAEQQADQRLDDLLGRADSITLENPLRYSTLKDTPVGKAPVVQYKAGQNGADLSQVVPARPEAAGDERPGRLPAAQVVGALERPGRMLEPDTDMPVRLGQSPFDQLPSNDLPGNDLPTGQLPIDNLLGGGLPLIGGLLPSGGDAASFDERPTARQAEAYEGGMPLLGGLSGLLPVNALSPSRPGGTAPDTSLPAGGTTVQKAVTPTAAPTTPAEPTDQPAQKQPAPDATPDDPRLHEEPIDGEHTQGRPFSPDVRPIAGVDQQYK